MASERFDLHTHSTASDGVLSPREVVALAAERGLSGLALTDHDTVDGTAEAQAMAQVLGLQCISGIELSCASDFAGEVHILGYFLNPLDADLLALVGVLHEQRMARAASVVELINSLGGEMSMDDVLEESHGRAPGRPHIARAMIRRGVAGDTAEAFSPQWLAPGGRAWVRGAGVPVQQAIEVIHAAGGVAVFAHPGSRGRGQVREEALRHAASVGLDGVEVDHPDHTDDVVRRCVELAAELNLVQTSGSDDHGVGVDGPRLGCRTVSGRVIESLRLRAEGNSPAS